jgi:photosystem II stability/assembly factor-like uncharacterized protein
MAVIVFVSVGLVHAHSPHDVIDALTLSPTYDQDKTLFIAISDHLKKSTDGGFSWKELVNGLDHKHLLSSIAISPSFQVDETLFVSSDGDGIYRSESGGTSWVKVNVGLSNLKIDSLTIYPDYVSEQIVLAAGTKGGLYRTDNGGDCWKRVMAEDIKVTAVAFFEGEKEQRVLAGDRDGNLYLSVNSGQDWQQSFRNTGSGAITVIAVSPNISVDGIVFVGTEKKGVFKTVDWGISFEQVNKGMSERKLIFKKIDKHIVSLGISPDYATDSTLFASTWYEAVFISTNGGKSWQKYDKGLTTVGQADSEKYLSPHFREVKLSKTFGQDKTIFLGGFDGLFKSTDGGQSWTQMETSPLRLIKGLALSSGDKDYSSVAITTYGGGAYTITIDDRGRAWAVNNGGLKKTRLSDIVFSPNYRSDNTIFSASRGYLLKSNKRGKAWDKVSLAFKSWRTRLSHILRRLRLPRSLSRSILSEAEKEKPFATVIAPSPNFASDKTIYFGTRYHGIFKSVDCGLNNLIVWDGMGRTITSMVISPDFASDKTLFVGVRGKGVYKTVDAGDTWQPVNSGLTFIDTWQKSAIIHQIKQKDIKLAISPDYRTSKTVFASTSEGLFKTTNAGGSWQQLDGAAYGRDSYILNAAISPNYEKDQTLIVSVKGRGLFKSDNGGMTFAKIAPELINSNHAIEFIKFTRFYVVDSTIYGASREELFQSTDGGNTWKTIRRLVRYENMRDVISYEGGWKLLREDDFSATSVSHSNDTNNKATLNFVGTGIAWIGTKSDDLGIAKVYIDGEYQGDIDQFSNTRETMVEVYSRIDLAYGPHTITIEVTDQKNPRSNGYRIEIDAFDVLP